MVNMQLDENQKNEWCKIANKASYYVLHDFNYNFLTNQVTHWSRVLEERTGSQSRSCSCFMEPEDLLLFQKSPSSVIIRSKLNPFHGPFQFLYIHFNIIFPFASRFSKWDFYLRVSYQTPVWPSHRLQTFYMTRLLNYS